MVMVIEIVFHRPSARSTLPAALIGTEQMVTGKLLAVVNVSFACMLTVC